MPYAGTAGFNGGWRSLYAIQKSSSDRMVGKHRMFPRPFNPTLLTQDSRDYIVRFKPRPSISGSGISRSCKFHEKTGGIDEKPALFFCSFYFDRGSGISAIRGALQFFLISVCTVPTRNGTMLRGKVDSTEFADATGIACPRPVASLAPPNFRVKCRPLSARP